VRVAVTGTPGTGKTTVTDLLETDLDVVHLNDVIREEGLYDGVDEARDSVYTDLDAVREWLDGREDVVFESHLAHHVPADRVVVLRCHPEELERRLLDRGDSEAKATENAESEALDVVLSEAVAACGLEHVYEVDTTDRSPAAVATEVETCIAGERAPSAGEHSFVDYL